MQDRYQKRGYSMRVPLPRRLEILGDEARRTRQALPHRNASSGGGCVRLLAGTTHQQVMYPVPSSRAYMAMPPRSLSNCDFSVVFTEANRKPLGNPRFDKQNKRSGKPRGAKGSYKYSVIVGEGALDPTIIIR